MSEAIELIIDPPERDLGGGFTVRRALPHPGRRMVGPFIFFDQMGPSLFAPGHGLDVRPHPHIGLSTVTYLFDGEIMHRDSLGHEQAIRPGEVNWMTAGRGIVHSERTGRQTREAGHRLHGIQTWVALPADKAEIEPCFAHHGSAELPGFRAGDAEMTLILGSAYGHRSPVAVLSPMFYIDAQLQAGGRLALPAEHAERGIHLGDGSVTLAGQTLAAGQMAILRPGDEIEISADADSRLMLFGGAPLGKRHIFWNFVASSAERIEQAKQDWRDQRFGQVPGETEFIPLPE